MMTRIIPLIALLAAATGIGAFPAQADLSLALDLGPDGTVQPVSYACGDGTRLTVRYVNTGSNALALIPLKGEVLIFAGVIAGSGARYVSGASEWLTKSDQATLRTEQSQAEPLTCTASSGN